MAVTTGGINSSTAACGATLGAAAGGVLEGSLVVGRRNNHRGSAPARPAALLPPHPARGRLAAFYSAVTRETQGECRPPPRHVFPALFP